MNVQVLIGRVGKDCETFKTENGKEFSKFTLATSKYWNNEKGERQEETEWHNVIMFGGMSKLADYIKKGKRIAVQGSKKTTTWQDKEGNTQYQVQTVANEIEFLDSKNVNTQQEEKDDLPF